MWAIRGGEVGGQLWSCRVHGDGDAEEMAMAIHGAINSRAIEPCGSHGCMQDRALWRNAFTCTLRSSAEGDHIQQETRLWVLQLPLYELLRGKGDPTF
jgi:hypothetical protein